MTRELVDAPVTVRLGGRFAKLWTAGTTSALGSGLTTVAAPLLVAAETDSPFSVAAASAVAWLPWLLFALPGGALADRVDRRKLMIVLDWVRAAAVFGLGVAILGGVMSVWLLYSVLFVINAGEIVMRVASQAIVPDLVPREQLERANGWLFGGLMLAQNVIAAPLGSLLFVVAASSPFLGNAATYAASALLLWSISGRYRVAAGTKQKKSFRGEIVEGFRWLAGQRLLRTMVGLIALLNVTLTAATSVLVLLARDRLGLGEVGYGLLFTAMAAGAVIGSVIGDRIIAWVRPTWTIRIGLLIEAGMHLALAASREAWLIGLVLVLFGVHGTLWGIVGSSLRQRLTPPELLGRAGSVMIFVAAAGNSVGALLGGALASMFDITTPYWVGFVVATVVAVASWRVFNGATVEAAYAKLPP
ncbi:MFS transporter [Dactylosporangium sp. AC04546]|uniref:MFS transporter n=1 Tax=Dactylosporangium sp. AC04546 TaxID=2862460 RepID=UPI001EE0BEDA|nr:MFS transporter [Dactylosporangium sp. AC04546]WVK84679.1 MFS transporter [Dactylosporangium sp. AC04546]